MSASEQGSYTFPFASFFAPSWIFGAAESCFTLQQLHMLVRGNHLENLNFRNPVMQHQNGAQRKVHIYHQGWIRREEVKKTVSGQSEGLNCNM